MIRVFQSIRQRLLVKKKVTNYLLYAAGEIILVVIGILIALAINNLNLDRLDARNEQTYLRGLQKEFMISKAKLNELMAVNQRNYEGANRLLEFISKPGDLPSETIFSELLFNTFSSDVAFNPNNSLLNEMINSGNVRNISNTRLRILLTNWIATVQDISRQERDLELQREKLLDMLRGPGYSLKTILSKAGVYDILGLSAGQGETDSNLSLLSSQEFENKLLMFVLANHAMEESHYKPLMQDLDDILELIGEEIR